MFISNLNLNKRFYGLLLSVLFIIISKTSSAQISQDLHSFSKFNVFGGYDQLNKTQKSPYNDNKVGGFHAGVGFDKYWGMIGVGIDAEYAKNKKFSYDSTGLFGLLNTSETNNFSQSAKATERITVTLGPSIKQILGRSTFMELALHGGVSKVSNGDLAAKITNSPIYSDPGYTSKTYLPLAKATFRVNQLLTKNIVAFAQAEYLYYFNSTTNVEYFNRGAANISSYKYDLNSFRGSAGISYIIPSKKSEEKIPEPVALTEPTKAETPAKADTKMAQVELIDEQSGFRLYNADVTLTDDNGETFTAKTNKAGIATFEELPKGNYRVKGELNGIETTGNSINVADFADAEKELKVTLKHNDPRFTLVGFTTNKATGTREEDVEVKLKNDLNGNQSTIMSKDKTGEFLFQLQPNSDYSLYGKKESYISNIEKITTKGLDRSTTLYVLLELGVEEAKIDKIIKLNNIYYDLDKAEIRRDASTDLNKLLQFLNDNPKTKIQVNSHTDSRGTSDYNLNLSDQRAQNVRYFLMSNGIDSKRIIAVGYGENMLINRCADGVSCSEAEHQLNRRTEFKVVR